jgi:hypothetical protein
MLRATLALSLLLLLASPASAHHRTAKGYRAVNTAVIHHVFGKYGTQAVQVAKCESGLTVWARNGQYLGLFQMGDYARGRYGHSWNPWAQARAAFRYFRDSGYDWSPWACKPW